MKSDASKNDGFLEPLLTLPEKQDSWLMDEIFGRTITGGRGPPQSLRFRRQTGAAKPMICLYPADFG
jgi:hypothetical protein